MNKQNLTLCAHTHIHTNTHTNTHTLFPADAHMIHLSFSTHRTYPEGFTQANEADLHYPDWLVHYTQAHTKNLAHRYKDK